MFRQRPDDAYIIPSHLDDSTDNLPVAAHSDEPMPRPDHKAKRHPRPHRHGRRWPNFPGARPNEEIGAGYFVFKRGKKTGRIETAPHRFAGGIPFEHKNFGAAVDEAARLTIERGGTFEVFTRCAMAGPLDSAK